MEDIDHLAGSYNGNYPPERVLDNSLLCSSFFWFNALYYGS